MLTIIAILAVSAFIGIIISAMGKCPLWVPCLFIAIIECLRVLPLGR
jgi:hypothetical protein